MVLGTTDNQSIPETPFPVGGVLQHHINNWTVLQPSPAISQVLHQGYVLPFISPPPQSKPRTFPQKPELEPLVYEQVSIMLNKGAIERVVPPYGEGFYSRVFVVPKSSGGWRPVIDLSSLNQYIRIPKFKMETVQSIAPALQDSRWAVTVDLSDAYFHVPIHPKARPYLRFVCRGTVFQFRALPFGLATAPFVFTWILRPFVRHLRAQGIFIHVYQDDWLVHHPDFRILQLQLQTVLDLARNLGFRVNYDKSQLTPVQSLQYLGVQINLRSQILQPPLSKCQDIQERVSRILNASPRPASEWNTLLGKLAFLSQVVPEGRLHCRQFQCNLRANWTFDWRKDRHKLIPLPPSVVPHLQWWLHLEHLLRGVPLAQPSPTLQLFTDASSEGWGAHLLHLTASGLWSPVERNLHINSLEMLAVYKAVISFQQTLKNQTVMIASDNSTVLGYLRNQGGTKSALLLEQTYQFFQLAASINMTFFCRHIPGKKNILADQLSRRDQVIQTEWMLSAQVLEQLWQRWSRPLIDAFATCLTRRLPDYYSPVPDPQARAIDALSVSWEGPPLYMFPPTPLLHIVLRKLLSHPHAEVILIFPRNPQAPWFPLLLRLLNRPGAQLVQLPPRDDLIAQPITGVLMPNVQALNFHALRLLRHVGEIEVPATL